MGSQESRVNYTPPHRPQHYSEHERHATESLERDVRHRRHNIDDLLDELFGVVHPKVLMRQAVDWVRSGENRRSVQDKAAGAGESLKESGRQVSRKISDKITSLTQGAKTASRDALEKRRHQTRAGLHHAKEGAAREMVHVKERAAASAQESPLVVALGFLGAGLIAGLMAPRTQAERKVTRKASNVFARGSFQNADSTTTAGRSEAASA